MGLFLFVAAAMAPAQSATCQRLMRDFVENEVSFSVVHGINMELVDAARKFGDQTGDFSSWRKEREQSALQDQSSEAKGDRITSLMAAQQCALPDHLTSFKTYESQLAACRPVEQVRPKPPVCNIADNAMTELDAKASRQTPRRRSRAGS